VEGGEQSRELAHVKHFDNCALPGAFLSAANHFMANHMHQAQYHWRASTLVPPRNLVDQNITDTYVQFNALGDMYGMYQENKAHWLMDMLPRADGSQCTGAHTAR
jgi:hypothetical protein